MDRSDIWYLFLTLNIWLGFTVIFMVAVTALALTHPLFSIGIGYLLAPLLVVFVYVEERRSLEPEDVFNHPYRTSLVRRSQKSLLATSLIALIGYEVLLVFLVLTNPTAGLGYIGGGQIPLVVLGLYSQLKRHPTFDSLAVGGVWAFVIVLTVVVSTDQRLTIAVLPPFIAWFLITGAGVESRNIADRYGDTQANKHTLAGYLGWMKGTVLVTLLKISGVVIFYVSSGLFPAILVVGILGILRAFRTLTSREEGRVHGHPLTGGFG